MGNGVADAVLAEPTPDAPTTVAFVGDHTLRSTAGATWPVPLDVAVPEQGFEHDLIMALTSRQQQRQGTAMAVRAQVDLSTEAAAASAQRLARLTSLGTCSMLVSAHTRAVEEVERPVQLAKAVSELPQGSQDALPDTSAPPAVEAAGDRVPGTEALRQIPPRSAGRQNPEDTIEDASMGMVRSANKRFLRWKQGS